MNEEQTPADAIAILATNGISFQDLLAKGFDARQPFTEDVFAPIAEEYGFDPNGVATARICLNVGAHLAAKEAKWFATTLPKVRKRLAAIKRQSRALKKSLHVLDDEDLYSLNEAAVSNELASNTDLMRLYGEEPVPPSASVSWDGERATLNRPEDASVALIDFEIGLSALEDAMNMSLHVAGLGKKGRRKDATLEPLFLCGFQMFENFTDKEFKLDWFKKIQPASDGARFCVDIARVFDNEIKPTQIVSAANAARKLSVKVTNLEEGLDFAKYYSKQIR